jgi:hypothetical protein
MPRNTSVAQINHHYSRSYAKPKAALPRPLQNEQFPALRYVIAGIVLFWRFSGLLRIMDIIDGGKITGEGQMRVPTFFANPDDDLDWMVEGPSYLCFCILHCNYIWRTSFGWLGLLLSVPYRKRYLARCLYHHHGGGGSWLYCNYF